MSKREVIPVAVTPDTHKRLREMGKFGDTYDSIIKRLLDRQQEQVTKD